MKEKIVLIGAGSACFTRGLVADMIRAARLHCVETVVYAALEGSREKFVQALIIDGAVSSPDVAERLADDLLQAQARYLPQFRAGTRTPADPGRPG